MKSLTVWLMGSIEKSYVKIKCTLKRKKGWYSQYESEYIIDS